MHSARPPAREQVRRPDLRPGRLLPSLLTVRGRSGRPRRWRPSSCGACGSSRACGWSRRTPSDYKVRLLEKQRLRAQLDATVLRAGFARTTYQARQAVVHRHVTVNGERVDRPGFQLRPGDTVAVRERSREKVPFVLDPCHP